MVYYLMWAACLWVACPWKFLSASIFMRNVVGYRNTTDELAGTMEQPHTNLLYSIPFSENSGVMHWLIVIERSP